MAAVLNEGWDIRFNIKSNEVPLCLQELNLVVVELKLALQAFHQRRLRCVSMEHPSTLRPCKRRPRCLRNSRREQ